jgi:N-acetyl-anhydromuramyl-L-alanine amidase AmpD
MFKIDKNTYNKAKRIPYNPNIACGYQPRPIGRLDIRSIIDHTTNGRKGNSLHLEANYICNSRDISSHYLIGKQGQIIEFLDPVAYIAYHAGCVKSTTFSNPFSIGIEMHNTPTEGPCTPLQLEALDWLVKQLIEKFNIKEANIETHRAVAIFCKGHRLAGKLGRKIDPSGFPDNQFYAWRESLYKKPTMTKYKVVASKVNIRTSPQVNRTNVVGQLIYGDIFESVATVKDELNQVINGKNTWAHLTKGTHNGKKVDGLGFVHASNLIIIG